MKKIISIILTLFASVVFFAAGAQTVYSRGKLYVDGQPLAVENASLHLSAALSADYAKALTTEKVGSVLAYTGGLVTYLIGRNQVRLIGEQASASSQAELDFSFTPSGIGLALNF